MAIPVTGPQKMLYWKPVCLNQYDIIGIACDHVILTGPVEVEPYQDTSLLELIYIFHLLTFAHSGKMNVQTIGRHATHFYDGLKTSSRSAMYAILEM